MNSTNIIEHPFYETFEYWPVLREWRESLHGYLIMGLPPGSFFTCCFANDLHGAASHSHISNTWESIRFLMHWVNEYAPKEAWGDHEKVKTWLEYTSETRKKILVDRRLLFTPEQATWHQLNSEKVK